MPCSVLEKQGERINDVDEFFENLDQKGDGKICFAEFREHWLNVSDNPDDLVASARCCGL